MRAVTREFTSPHCTRLLDHFTTAGKSSAGEYECFVMPLYGGDVSAFRKSLGAPVPLPLAKRIILHLLRGLAHVHSYGMVHTDLKFNNVFYETTMMDEDIQRWLEDYPFRQRDPELSYDGVMQAAVSQHLPTMSLSQASKARFVLGDLGSGRCNVGKFLHC